VFGFDLPRIAERSFRFRYELGFRSFLRLRQQFLLAMCSFGAFASGFGLPIAFFALAQSSLTSISTVFVGEREREISSNPPVKAAG
jgi:hypothetical protein